MQDGQLTFTGLVISLHHIVRNFDKGLLVGWNRPICRTVADAVYVLDAIAGIDHNDNATIQTSRYIPKGGYAQFLNSDGLRGKRLGIVRAFYNFGNDTIISRTVEQHLKTLR